MKTVAEMTAAELADEHRGLGFAKRRAAGRIKDIETELDRRGLSSAKGAIGIVEKKPTVLLDLDRLRAERPDIVKAFALGEGGYWSSGTLPPGERAKDQRG